MSAKTADRNSFSPQANRISTRKKDSRMSRRDARLAVTPVKTPEAAPSVRCMMLCALPAESPAKCHSSRQKAARYTAATVSQSSGKKSDFRDVLFGARLFILVFRVSNLKNNSAVVANHRVVWCEKRDSSPAPQATACGKPPRRSSLKECHRHSFFTLGPFRVQVPSKQYKKQLCGRC